MNRIAIVSAILAAAGVISAQASDLASIIQRVSENCDKIQSFSADAEVRYKIWPNWYDRIGRYEYQKPDSTALVLMDSVSGTDTAWSVYTGSSFTGCAFSIVPSVIINPIMSAQTVSAWADSAAAVIRDTLDTCVVKVPSAADTVLYSIDMARGVIIGLYWYGPSGNVTHQYFYGYDKGIYFLQKVSCSSTDTSIINGGYLFSNIRINGEPVTSVAGRLRPEKPPFAIHPIGRRGDRIAFTGGKAGMRITAFDLAGRSLFETSLQGTGDMLRLDRFCGGGACPGGALIFRIIGPNGAAFFSTTSTRQ